MPRYFQIDQAQKLLPELEPRLRELTSLKADFEEVAQELHAVSERLNMLGGVLVDRQKVGALRSRREALAARLKQAIEAVHERGCLIKDLDLGLVDFPTLLRGEEVYLCWKLGEPSIEFWHGVSEGFRGRKPVDQEFLDNHQGE